MRFDYLQNFAILVAKLPHLSSGDNGLDYACH